MKKYAIEYLILKKFLLIWTNVIGKLENLSTKYTIRLYFIYPIR